MPKINIQLIPTGITWRYLGLNHWITCVHCTINLGKLWNWDVKVTAMLILAWDYWYFLSVWGPLNRFVVATKRYLSM